LQRRFCGQGGSEAQPEEPGSEATSNKPVGLPALRAMRGRTAQRDPRTVSVDHSFRYRVCLVDVEGPALRECYVHDWTQSRDVMNDAMTWAMPVTGEG
jgi:hypothetical protein